MNPKPISISYIFCDLFKRRWYETMLRILLEEMLTAEEILKRLPELPASALPRMLRTFRRYQLIMRYPSTRARDQPCYRATDLAKDLLNMAEDLREIGSRHEGHGA